MAPSRTRTRSRRRGCRSGLALITITVTDYFNLAAPGHAIPDPTRSLSPSATSEKASKPAEPLRRPASRKAIAFSSGLLQLLPFQERDQERVGPQDAGEPDQVAPGTPFSIQEGEEIRHVLGDLATLARGVQGGAVLEAIRPIPRRLHFQEEQILGRGNRHRHALHGVPLHRGEDGTE